jgi:hypothetical protein
MGENQYGLVAMCSGKCDSNIREVCGDTMMNQVAQVWSQHSQGYFRTPRLNTRLATRGYDNSHNAVFRLITSSSCAFSDASVDNSRICPLQVNGVLGRENEMPDFGFTVDWSSEICGICREHFLRYANKRLINAAKRILKPQTTMMPTNTGCGTPAIVDVEKEEDATEVVGIVEEIANE